MTYSYILEYKKLSIGDLHGASNKFKVAINWLENHIGSLPLHAKEMYCELIKDKFNLHLTPENLTAHNYIFHTSIGWLRTLIDDTYNNQNSWKMNIEFSESDGQTLLSLLNAGADEEGEIMNFTTPQVMRMLRPTNFPYSLTKRTEYISQSEVKPRIHYHVDETNFDFRFTDKDHVMVYNFGRMVKVIPLAQLTQVLMSIQQAERTAHVGGKNFAERFTKDERAALLNLAPFKKNGAGWYAIDAPDDEYDIRLYKQDWEYHVYLQDLDGVDIFNEDFGTFKELYDFLKSNPKNWMQLVGVKQ